MKRIIQKILKILSTIMFWILILIMIVLVGYLVVVKVLESQGKIADMPINFYTILSQSMYPTIEAGDMIITYQNENDIYEVGDVITFVSTSGVSNGVTITHRIVSVDINGNEYMYSTKGDNNSTKDSNSVSQNNVIGKYLFKIPKAGFIQNFLVSKTGWIVAILFPSLGIIIYDIIKIIKKAPNKLKKKKQEIDVVAMEAKKELDESIGNDTVSLTVQQQVENAYEDMGIKPTEEKVENLFEEPANKGDDDETEIL